MKNDRISLTTSSIADMEQACNDNEQIRDECIMACCEATQQSNTHPVMSCEQVDEWGTEIRTNFATDYSEKLK